METQSSGRSCLKVWPLSRTTVPPRATLKRSSGVVVTPNIPASKEKPVCTWATPQKTRVGIFLVRVGRIVGLLGFDFACSLARRGILGCGEVTEAAGHEHECDGPQTRASCALQQCVSYHGIFSLRRQATNLITGWLYSYNPSGTTDDPRRLRLFCPRGSCRYLLCPVHSLWHRSWRSRPC